MDIRNLLFRGTIIATTQACEEIMEINTPRIADKDLVTLIRMKKKEGAVALYDTYAKALFLAIIRIVPEKEIAGNVLEQTFITAWRSFDSYSAEKEKVLAWMMAIARKLARNS